MKNTIFSFIAIILVCTSCESPKYLLENNHYNEALQKYHAKLLQQKKYRKNKKDLIGLETSYALAQARDRSDLEVLIFTQKEENWPAINQLHRKIQERQRLVHAYPGLQSPKGYQPVLEQVAQIDSLEADSRKRAAHYLYTHAQHLLEQADSTGSPAPAREAYYTLRDLKQNYFAYWENANALLDSAYATGKAHILFEGSADPGLTYYNTFWDGIDPARGYRKNEWIAWYGNPSLRESFDYSVRCRLASIYIGPEYTSTDTRTETKQVEDGYEEKLDSAGRVISREKKYRCETITITTWSATRDGYATALYELVDLHTGAVLHQQSIPVDYRFSESSEYFMVSAPSASYIETSLGGDAVNEARRVTERFLMTPKEKATEQNSSLFDLIFR